MTSETMKFEIKIKEEDWHTLDSNSAIEVLDNKTRLSDEDLLSFIQAKFPASQNNEGTEFKLLEGTEYFYGCMYLPFFSSNTVSDYLFRTKDPKLYRITRMYSLEIDRR